MENVLTFRVANHPDYRRVALQTFRITIGLFSLLVGDPIGLANSIDDFVCLEVRMSGYQAEHVCVTKNFEHLRLL